jgi:hypothetical protein
MKAYVGEEVYKYAFVTSVLDGKGWFASSLACLTPGERDAHNHRMGSWVDPLSGWTR